MTRAEDQYKQQLEQWSGVVSQMNEQVLALRVLSSAPQPPSTSTPVKATPGSPRPPQPPLFSTTTTNNAASSPVPGRYGRPPAFAARAPYTPSSVAPGSTPSKQPSTAGRSNVFQTPQTPGTFKSPTGPLYRPYSTPSASSPTPVGSTVPAAAAAGDKGSATFNRRYHTHPPSIAASSPNFYSAYKASHHHQQQQGGTDGGADRSIAGATAASVHQTTPGGVGSTTKVAQPSPSPSLAQSQSGTTVSLSEEDQEACMELLVSQTRLLEKARDELSALEEKVRALKQERKVQVK